MFNEHIIHLVCHSQKIYSSYYKSVTEILELFRKTQEVHARFLRFLDTHIYFDFLSDNEIVACKESNIHIFSLTSFI
jgi:hypothetical protein